MHKEVNSKMDRTKGQAAMEFLMTYGWAILVVLVAIGALAYFGVLSPEKLLPEKCLISTGSGLFCDKAFADAANDVITLRVKNSNIDAIEITSVQVGSTCTDPTTVTTIAADTGADVDVICTGLTAGKIKADLTIKYKLIKSAAEGGNFTTQTTGSLVTTAA